MIDILIPNNNIPERKYIIDVIFDEFLGLKYEVKVKTAYEEDNWRIEFENGNKLIIEDHFFNKFPKNLEYLKQENIPNTINYEQKTNNYFIPENNIPIIYGTSKLEIKNQQQKTITCGIDIFASSFFMLTRWEEYVIKNRDTHGRFSAYESLALRHNFLDRPIVNEYLEMLKNMLKYLSFSEKTKERKYDLVLTHDIDIPKLYNSWWSVIKEGIKEYRKSNKIYSFKDIFKSYIYIKKRAKKDPFDTFDYLMKCSEDRNLKSYFFFMAKGTTSYDNFYSLKDEYIQQLIKEIKDRGHKIGFHPSYSSYRKTKQFEGEKKELEQITSQKVQFGRQHYLRFEIPTTWKIWDDNNMSWDSSLCYAEKEGFRCGVCYEFQVFDILSQKILRLKEKPLIVMDGNFVTYQRDITESEMIDKVKILKDKVKKYDGRFVFLWHNNTFSLFNNNDIYERIIDA